jgi:D-alanyl-D-alanine carboxypeptidase
MKQGSRTPFFEWTGFLAALTTSTLILMGTTPARAEFQTDVLPGVPTPMVQVPVNLPHYPPIDPSLLFLAIAGVSGTLKNRFQGTPLVGRVHAKPGTLRGVRALSGYLEHSTQGVIAFSIVVNQPGQDGAVMVRAIDQIMLQLNHFTGCQ